MALYPQDYVEHVLDDVAKYNGIRKPARANFIDRLLTKKLSPSVLHPNPEDEFSMPEIGPNFEIIGHYVSEVQRLQRHGEQVYEEAIIVEKMLPDGYMLLNGHHRWFAALRMSVGSIKVELVNLVHEADVADMIARSIRDRRASFDLDEVLFAPAGSPCTEPLHTSTYEQFLDKRFRKGVPDMLRRIQELGYDVWVYTSGYYDAEDIKGYFGEYGVILDGIVNGIGRNKNKTKDKMRTALNTKYNVTLHIDTDHVLNVDSVTHDYDFVTLNSTPENWCDKVVFYIEAL